MLTRAIIQFSHANGFPAPCYRSMLERLADDFEIDAVERIGHDPRFPVSEGWPHLVDELIAAIESRGRAPVLGVGHSLGGYLTALAAARRPDLFRAVILLDAPIMGAFKGSAIQFVKHIGLIDRVTPAGGMKNRRREWSSRADALAHFRRRKVFADFAPECLEDYVRFGTVDLATGNLAAGNLAAEDCGGGVRLWFDPDIEYRIYRTIPHDIAAAVKRLRVPGGFIGGRDSDVLRRVGLGHTRRHFRLALLAAGHLFPFQFPDAAAQAVRRMARDLGAL
jgi:pimeloyl-ACP methyl ester carboxylesterase